MNLKEDTAATLDHIRKLERSRFAAMISGDAEAVSKFLDDDLIYIHTSGLADSKAAYLRSFENGEFSYKGVEVVDDRHVCGEDTFILYQHLSVRMQIGTNELARQVSMTSVWRKSAKGWLLLVMQATPMK
jgi:ketosteroid isomerase-like protein